jgi:hypothetical protein
MKKLSKNEMRTVMGGVEAAGGTCQALVYIGTGGFSTVMVNLTSYQASHMEGMVHWCCTHCSTATWAVDLVA